MGEALHVSHHTLFAHYPLVSPEKGCSDLQTWPHCGTHLVWGVTHNLHSLCWLTHHVLFMFIRRIRCLCLASAPDAHCSLLGITINFQQRSFKSPAICQAVSHKPLWWIGNGWLSLWWMYKNYVFYMGDGNSFPQTHMCSPAGFLGSCIHISEQTTATLLLACSEIVLGYSSRINNVPKISNWILI